MSLRKGPLKGIASERRMACVSWALGSTLICRNCPRKFMSFDASLLPIGARAALVASPAYPIPVLQDPLAYDCAPQIHGTFQATVPPMPSCIPAHQATTHDCLAQDDHSFDGGLTHSRRNQANSGRCLGPFSCTLRSPPAARTNVRKKVQNQSQAEESMVLFPSTMEAFPSLPDVTF